MDSIKPIKIWVTSSGPNPWKVVIILEELAIPYEYELVTFDFLVSKEFRKINHVGKVPVIQDANTGVLIAESGAIILYLVEEYDKENKLSYTTTIEKSLAYQWLMFQMSQQGPFFGQLSWFNYLHPEDVPSAKDRYTKQMERILGALNTALESKDWLVGDKCTFADLSFFTWNQVLPSVALSTEEQTPLNQFPNVLAWHKRMAAMPSVKKITSLREELIAADGMKEAIKKNDRSEWSEIGERTNAGGE